ncbi:HAD family hydrolase [Cognatitamlana onchidii]|uniref:HAD family hydrolase n=1 Tax=Cognatitamlana onchidii TaxID=2562860 RepID=UPI0010A62086|nr:HAD family hydrolase [Algibacter onchidii]
MDFSKVKLVVTDMDGTLLNEHNEVSTKFLNQFEELRNHNIHFVAASGRQYQSIVGKLYSIKDDISIIAENGGILDFENKKEVLFKLSSYQINSTVKAIRAIEGAHIVLCGKKTAYIESRDDAFISKFKMYYSDYEIVRDLTRVKDDEFIKIAVYHFDSSELYVKPFLKNIDHQLKVLVSAQNWLDIALSEVDKSYGLQLLQQKLKIKTEETMVFGDYNNDLNMLKLANFSYAMENAHANVKQVANYETKSNVNQGVEYILEKLLAQRS